MRIEEAILFLAVVALSLALVVVVVAPILRQRRRSPAQAPGVVRDVPEGPASLSLEGTHACPACHRHQPGEFRFCPFDGTPLDVRLPITGDRGAPALTQDASGATVATSGGKICPSCSRRYRLDTAVCPRDGAPLVAVN